MKGHLQHLLPCAWEYALMHMPHGPLDVLGMLTARLTFAIIAHTTDDCGKQGLLGDW